MNKCKYFPTFGFNCSFIMDEETDWFVETCSYCCFLCVRVLNVSLLILINQMMHVYMSLQHYIKIHDTGSQMTVMFFIKKGYIYMLYSDVRYW
jgi:hypothetical protein